MENTINKRVIEIINHFNISGNEFAKRIGIPQTTFSNIINRGSDIKASIIESISTQFGDISLDWLITGNGEMLKSSTSQYQLSDKFTEGAIPYYDNLPVSAGQLDLATYKQDEKPTGWINIPGVSAKGLFPVIGCSMKPDINPGDVVGLCTMDRWEMVDPDKVYLIITRDDRMIKHLMIDETNEDILWCISPNYHKFPIRKDEIVFIYRITFHGKLM